MSSSNSRYVIPASSKPVISLQEYGVADHIPAERMVAALDDRGVLLNGEPIELYQGMGQTGVNYVRGTDLLKAIAGDTSILPLNISVLVFMIANPEFASAFGGKVTQVIFPGTVFVGKKDGLQYFWGMIKGPDGWTMFNHPTSMEYNKGTALAVLRIKKKT